MNTNINIKKRIDIQEEGVSITPDVNSINFIGAGVTTSTVGDNVTVNVQGSIGATAYYLNETVTQAPYKEFSSIPTAAAEQTIATVIGVGATATIQSFQTPSGVPNTTNIPAGLWQFYLHFSGTAGNSWDVYVEVYKRDSGGIETLLLTTDVIPITVLSAIPTMILTDGVFPTSTVLTTDRIVVKVLATNTGVAGQTITFHTEGSTNYSVGTITLNQIVPTGAVTSVTGTAPVVSSGGTTPAISIPQSSATVDGYLSSSNWSVFDAKQAALLGTGIVKSTAGTISYLTDNSTNWDTAYTNRITSLTTTGSGAATLISNVLNIPTPSSVNIYNSNGVLTGARTVDLAGYNLTFNDLSGTSTITLNITDGADDYSYLNHNIGGFILTSGSGSFSKSLYVNSIGVGIYASGTAGAYYLPNSQPTLNQIPYASSTTQLGFTSVKTINGNSILGSGNLVIGGGGIWGIANSSGIYTYYATYQLAVAAAVAGQTIEMFGSQTESTANHILKNGVNINYNGYTLTFGGLFRLDDNNVACDVQLLNGEIKQPTTDGFCILVANSGTVIRGNVLVNSSGTNSYGLYGPATVIGLQFKGSYCLTLYSAGAKGKAYGVTINCTSNIAFGWGEIYNSVINSTSTNGRALQYVTNVINCSGIHNGFVSVYCDGVNIRNCSFTNLTSDILAFVTQDNNFFDSCYFRCAGNTLGNGPGNGKNLMTNCKISTFSYSYAFGSAVINMDNCTIISDTSYTFNQPAAGKFNKCTFIVRDGSNSFHEPATGVIKLNNCDFQLFNASAYPVYASSAKNFTASNNTYNTTNFQLNMTNLQTYTADAYGNQRLN